MHKNFNSYVEVVPRWKFLLVRIFGKKVWVKGFPFIKWLGKYWITPPKKGDKYITGGDGVSDSQ